MKRLEEQLRAAQGKQRTAPHASPSESPRLPASPAIAQWDSYVPPRSSAEIVEVVSRRTVFPPLPRTPPPAHGFVRKAQHQPEIYVHHAPPAETQPDDEFSWERYRSSRTWSPTLS